MEWFRPRRQHGGAFRLEVLCGWGACIRVRGLGVRCRSLALATASKGVQRGSSGVGAFGGYLEQTQMQMHNTMMYVMEYDGQPV